MPAPRLKLICPCGTETYPGTKTVAAPAPVKLMSMIGSAGGMGAIVGTNVDGR